MDKKEKQTKLKSDEVWYGKAYSYFSNVKCEAFPCHAVDNPEDFNCLFCYCPLYALGEKCGGNFKYIKDGIKDCSSCIVPHRRDNYGRINERFKDIVEMMKRNVSKDSK